MWSRVYETVERLSVRPSVHLSVCPIDRPQQRHVAGLLLSARRPGYIIGFCAKIIRIRHAYVISETYSVFVFAFSALILPSVLWRCWLGGRRGIRPVKNWVVGCWRGYLSGARCRLACGPADATASHCLLLHLNPDWFCLLASAHLSSPGKRAVKRVCACVYNVFVYLVRNVSSYAACHYVWQDIIIWQRMYAACVVIEHLYRVTVLYAFWIKNIALDENVQCVCVCVWHCAALCSSVGLADCEYGRRARHAGRSSVWNYRVNRRLLRMRETCRCPSAAYTRHQQRYYEHRFDAW